MKSDADLAAMFEDALAALSPEDAAKLAAEMDQIAAALSRTKAALEQAAGSEFALRMPDPRETLRQMGVSEDLIKRLTAHQGGEKAKEARAQFWDHVYRVAHVRGRIPEENIGQLNARKFAILYEEQAKDAEHKARLVAALERIAARRREAPPAAKRIVPRQKRILVLRPDTLKPGWHERLRKAREAKELSRPQVRRAMSHAGNVISVEAIRKHEKGNAIPREPTRLAYASLYGVPEKTLFPPAAKK